jgi:hypothetical protein
MFPFFSPITILVLVELSRSGLSNVRANQNNNHILAMFPLALAFAHAFNNYLNK